MSTSGLFEKSSYGAGNRMVYSALTHFERTRETHRHVAIKYVISGIESYQFRNRDHRVGDDQYLLISPGQIHDTYLKAENDVTGICINLDTSLLSDVLHVANHKNDFLLDNPLADVNGKWEVFENIYQAPVDPLGQYLGELGRGIRSFDPRDNGFEVYFQLAEKLLQAQGLVQKQVNLIHANAYTTRKELFKRVEIGRRMIEDGFAGPLSVEQVAGASALSTFHFSRVFKQVYGVSPHQYLVNKRLSFAKELLCHPYARVTDVALKVGFTDIFSFSKSFSKAFGISPREYSFRL